MTRPPIDSRVIPSLAAVHEAADRLRAFLTPTRLERSDVLSRTLGVDVWLKLECENPTGSFKVRGAYNVLASMSDAERSRGAVASSVVHSSKSNA